MSLAAITRDVLLKHADHILGEQTIIPCKPKKDERGLPLFHVIANPKKEAELNKYIDQLKKIEAELDLFLSEANAIYNNAKTKGELYYANHFLANASESAMKQLHALEQHCDDKADERALIAKVMPLFSRGPLPKSKSYHSYSMDKYVKLVQIWMEEFVKDKPPQTTNRYKISKRLDKFALKYAFNGTLSVYDRVISSIRSEQSFAFDKLANIKSVVHHINKFVDKAIKTEKATNAKR